MLFLPKMKKRPSRRDRSPRVDTTTSNFSVPSGGGVGVLKNKKFLIVRQNFLTLKGKLRACKTKCYACKIWVKFCEK